MGVPAWYRHRDAYCFVIIKIAIVQSDAGFIEDIRGSDRDVNSSLDSALHNDDSETVGFSEDGHSYPGTVVLGSKRRQ